ncbi:MAG: phospholipase D family protein [Myxococcales bacterium]|nr:phospholipase D family protein [Myxococcales bacterium]
MKTQVLTDARALNDAVAALAEWAETIRFAYAWMDTACPAWSQLPDEKITESVVGAHFAQTDPAVFDHFLAEELTENVGVIIEKAGTFHPKVIVGIKGSQARAVVGSSNFTRGGFGANTELNVLLQGKLTDDALAALTHFIDELWNRSDWITPAWAARYRELHENRPPKPPSPPRPGLESSGDYVGLESLRVTWPEWFEMLRNRFDSTARGGLRVPLFHEEGSYLLEARACDRIFDARTPFATLDRDSRRLLVGRKGVRASNGSFGGGGASGIFMHTVLEEPEALGALIDAVPRTGEVGAATAETFLTQAFALPSVGMAGATRLLAMKRPDRFLPVNGGNRDRIQAVFGFGITNVEHYLKLHEIIWSFPWATAPEPEDPFEREIWRWRVALLDTAYYVHAGSWD